ncbi:MAG TPA: hypothetical protein VL359_09600, partial [bacterium]|nr:hypothetical protein [bacterium]
MEQNLAVKPKAVVLRALRSLLPPLLDNWGDPNAFRVAALAVIMREAGTVFSTAAEADALAEQAYRLIVHLRNVHFRTINSLGVLDQTFKGLDPNITGGSAPAMLQSCVWLAMRIQQAAITYLTSGEGQSALTRTRDGLGNQSLAWVKALTEVQPLTLEKVETALAQKVREALGPQVPAYNARFIAGHIVEGVRQVVRQLNPGTNDTLRELTAAERFEMALSDAVRRAELTEARQRFAKLTPDGTLKKFEEFKAGLLRRLGQVARYAPMGFEAFCQAIESEMFPYPAQLEWVRPFIKPIYQNASQSNLFDGRTTIQSVNQRYQALRKSKQ